jgi:hypothetical protein
MVGVVHVVTALSQAVVLATGRISDELRWIVATTSLLVLTFWLVAPAGIEAVALAYAAIAVILWPVRIWVLARWQVVVPGTYWRRLSGPGIATAVMGAAVFACQGLTTGVGPVLQLTILVALGAVIYVVVLATIAPEALSRGRASMKVVLGR